MIPRRTLALLPAMGLALLWAGFTAYKTRAVAQELLDPPFYRPQPLARVQATFDDLARGDGNDPGGTWTSEEVPGLVPKPPRAALGAPGGVPQGKRDERSGSTQIEPDAVEGRPPPQPGGTTPGGRSAESAPLSHEQHGPAGPSLRTIPPDDVAAHGGFGTSPRGLQLWTLRRSHPAPGIVLLLHGFGDDRWGTSPALRWFPRLDAAIFTYLRRDDAIREGRPAPPVTFGARESGEVVAMVHQLEARGHSRNRILLMGRSLGASVGLLALSRLEQEGKGPLAGLIWEGAPASSRSFGERLVRGPENRPWHPFVAPLAGWAGSRLAGRKGGYDPSATELLRQVRGPLRTPSLCFLASRDRLAEPEVQRRLAERFDRIRVLEVPTWHLNCSPVLGPAYAQAIQDFTREIIPD